MRLTARELSIAERLSGVSLTLEPGSIIAICGPNGAGKSSLLEALAGLLHPDSGEVAMDGSALDAMPPRDRAMTIGYLPQAHEIAWDVPVRSLVELGRMPYGDRLAAPVDAALEALDIEHLAGRRAQSLSGGETARVLLARVLAGEPRWILADEPLAALDIGHQLALLRHLRRAAESGAGVVLVLHDLAHAMNHADRAIVLDEGRIAADGACEDALDRQVIERVWKVPVRWIGEAGHRALVSG
ncbi:MAG: ABC transporter ATP-binding protein [Erythrobacter sp.]|uniref:ABC transporter ATP-binding protein n=1 Tax=Erythrobacter sp. TaxID=1042 RepID=UPI001B29ADED|nr:ABC transporter ATP-binding protein [Erythrobacter sp.]MBO6525990.1 ABC transporter ATP-binding protein [Erythrobacter sp.]MBO6530661.1 ABC transporter ATP-binding protein [Erythrobacter sp.]